MERSFKNTANPRLLLLSVALLAGVCSSIALASKPTPTVFLTSAPSATTVWQGDCAAESVLTRCNQTLPCSLPLDGKIDISGLDNCTLSFAEGAYGRFGEVNMIANREVIEVTFIFESLVSHLNINISAPLIYFSRSQLSEAVALEASNLKVSIPSSDPGAFVTLKNLKTLNTRFFFHHGVDGSTPLSGSLDLKIKNCFLVIDNDGISSPSSKHISSTTDSFIGKDILETEKSLMEGDTESENLFVVSAANGTTRGMLTRFIIESSTVNLPREIGVISSQMKAYSIEIVSSTIRPAKHLAYLSTPKNTLVNIKSSASLYIVDALIAGPEKDANEFVSDDAIRVSVESSFLSGFADPEDHLPRNMTVLQRNACVHLNTEHSNFLLFELNCNHIQSRTNSRHRCRFTSNGGEYRNSKFCLLGPPVSKNSLPKIENTRFIVQQDDAKMGALIRDISLTANQISMLSQSTSGQDGLKSVVFEGNVNFTSGSSIATNSVYIERNASITFASIEISGIMEFGSDSRVQAAEFEYINSNQWTFIGQPRIVRRSDKLLPGDVDNTPSMRFDKVGSVKIVPNEKIGVSPSVVESSGVSFHIANLTTLMTKTTVDWNVQTSTSGVKPEFGKTYRFATFELPANGSHPKTDRVALRTPIGSSFEFYGSADIHAESEKVDFNFFLQKSDPPSSPPRATPVNAPHPTQVPAVHPKPSPSICQGSVYGAQFECVAGTWTFSQNLTLSRPLVISAVDRAVLVKGNVYASDSYSIKLVGTSSGIVVTGCIDLKEGSFIVFDYSKGWPSRPAAWNQTAFKQSPECSSTQIRHKLATPSGCVSARSKVEVFSVSTLVMSFEATRSKCNLIIALAVALAAVALLFVAIGVFFLLKRRARANGYEAINGNEEDDDSAE